MPLRAPLDATPEEVREALAPLRHPFSVAVHALGNAFAVGAIVRVAHNFLAREIVIIGSEPHYAKASMGMEKYERIVHVADDDAFFAHAAGRPVFAIEKDHARRSLYELPRFPDEVIFLFGSERAGLSAELCARADEALAIPIYGVNNSLPVAVAAGIVVSEWARRRYFGSRECPRGT
jgi:tRNA G18 (ribose-2'-O)-methylase SpoU